MLDVSRIIAGKLRIDTEPVDLTALAHDVIESMRPLASAEEIAVSLDTVSGHCRLAGDSLRLRQVLDNLLSNAVKFTPRGGRIVVSVDQHGDRVVVRVSDTGKGIDPSFLGDIGMPGRTATGSPVTRTSTAA